MSLVTHGFDLPIMPGSISPVLHLSQYDDARTFTAHLKDENGNAFELPSGATAKLEGMNCKGVTFDLEATPSGSDITFTPKEAATDQPGLIAATLHIKSGSENISMLAVLLNVQKAGATKEEQARSPGFTDAIQAAVEAWASQQGFTSPTVSITEITGGNRVTFTDKDGSHSIDVMNGQAGLESVDYEDFVFGETYKYRKDASEVQVFLRLNGAITGILKGLCIPVKQGQTLVLDNLGTVSRNGFSAVEIWSSYSTENNADYGKGITSRSKAQTYDTSPTGNGKYPVTSASAKYAYINLAFVSPGNSYSYPYYYSAYVLDEGEEQQASISRWYMNSQKKNFVVNQNQNKTLFWSLFQAVSPMVNANVLVMGDSITEFSAKDSNATDGRTTRPYFGYGWVTRILRKYNMTADIYGYASSRWWTQESGGSTAHSCVDTVTTVCANEDLPADNYQYIIIEYGTNDIMFRPGGFGSVNDAASSDVGCSTVAAAKYCINTLRTKFPKANIVVVMPTIIASRYQTDQETYIALMDKVFNSLGVKRAYPRYDAGITLSMMRDDGIHLDYWANNTHNNNTEAVRRFSKCVEAAMMEV